MALISGTDVSMPVLEPQEAILNIHRDIKKIAKTLLITVIVKVKIYC